MSRVYDIDHEEVDWWTEFGVFALNTKTYQFENCSYGYGLRVEIWDNPDYFTLPQTDGYEYFLYDYQLRMVGFAK